MTKQATKTLTAARAMYLRLLGGHDADEAEQAVAAKYGKAIAAQVRGECLLCD